jgi:thioredoxin-like negative regulator of GroEL
MAPLKKGRAVPKPKILKATSKVVKKASGNDNPSWAKYLITIVIVVLIAFTVFYIVQISKSAFNNKEERYTNPQKVVLLHSNTCPHCKDFLPIFDQARMSMQSAGIVFEDHETHTPQAQQYMGSLSGVPTVMVFDSDGTPVTSLVGKRSASQLTTELTNALNKQS